LKSEVGPCECMTIRIHRITHAPGCGGYHAQYGWQKSPRVARVRRPPRWLAWLRRKIRRNPGECAAWATATALLLAVSLARGFGLHL
jgi:hypothetical protein